MDWKKQELFKGEKHYIMNDIRLGQKCSTYFATDVKRLLISPLLISKQHSMTPWFVMVTRSHPEAEKNQMQQQSARCSLQICKKVRVTNVHKISSL
jgi:hypothetical protein